MIDRACIQLTCKCQLRCTYCHFDKHIDKSIFEDIKLETIQIILKNILDYAEHNDITKFKIGLVGAGESLLKLDLIKEIIEFVNIIDLENRLSFYTITNGISVDVNTIKWFYENKDRIKLNFSLDGTKRIHNSCRVFGNGAGSYDEVMKSIDLYKEVFNEVPTINSTVHKQSIDNSNELLAFFEKNFKKVTFSRLVDNASSNLYITKSEFNEFIKKASTTKLLLKQLKNKRKYDCTMYGNLCGVGRTNIFFANGKVYPCGRFVNKKEYELGNDTDSLNIINKSVEQLIPVDDGKCYYDENRGEEF